MFCSLLCAEPVVSCALHSYFRYVKDANETVLPTEPFRVGELKRLLRQAAVLRREKRKPGEMLPHKHHEFIHYFAEGFYSARRESRPVPSWPGLIVPFRPLLQALGLPDAHRARFRVCSRRGGT
jgi:hypothetical protein